MTETRRPVDVVAQALEARTGYHPPNERGDWKCPAHDDGNPSLGLSEGAEQCALLKCQAGCSTEQIVAEIGLTMADLFVRKTNGTGRLGSEIDHYDYVDAEGRKVFQVVRFEGKQFRQRHADGDGWTWNLQGVERVLYRLPAVLAAVEAGETIWIVEGERDVHALEHAGVTATCNPMGAGKWRNEFAVVLRGADVVIVADRDAPGRKHAHQIAQSLSAAGCDVRTVEAASGKDAADHLAAQLGLDDFVDVDLAGPETEHEQEATPLGQAPAERQETSWVEHNLAAVIDGLLAGTIVKPVPTVGRRSDGKCLFYAGRVNSLFGPSGDGKTMQVLWCACQELEAGHHVLMIDYEDNEEGIVGRLLDLGADPDDVLERFHYMSPEEPFDEVAEEVVTPILRNDVTLVIIDSTGESMALERAAANGTEDERVTKWSRRLPRKLAELGPAVVTNDHVTKDASTRGLYAIGSQRKRATITGAAYLVEVFLEFGKGRKGAAKLTVAKDRWGAYVRGSKAAEFWLDSTDDGLKGEMRVPPEAVSEPTAGPWKPTILMQKVSETLEALLPNGTSKNGVLNATGGKKEHKSLALELLVSERYVTLSKVGQAHHYRSARPYRHDQPEPDTDAEAEPEQSVFDKFPEEF